MSSVHCNIAPPSAVRLLESKGRQFSEFTILGFLPSTADASVVPRHGSVHLGLGDFFSRFTPLDLPCSVKTGSPLVGCSYSLRTDSLVCREVSSWCLKLHCCTPGLVRTSAGSTPYKGTTSLIPIEPLLLLLYFNKLPVVLFILNSFRLLFSNSSVMYFICFPVYVKVNHFVYVLFLTIHVFLLFLLCFSD